MIPTSIQKGKFSMRSVSVHPLSNDRFIYPQLHSRFTLTDFIFTASPCIFDFGLIRYLPIFSTHFKTPFMINSDFVFHCLS